MTNEPTRTTLLQEIRALPPAAWLLFVGTFVNRFGGFVLVFLVIYLTRKGYTAAQAGLAASAYGVGTVAASFVGGALADHIGRRRTIALSMFSAALTMLALSQATAFVLIVTLAALAGLTAELYRPASSAYLTDLTQPGHRVTVFALYRQAINLGMTVGPAVGGLLAERAFIFLFIGDAVTCVLFGAMALFVLPPSQPVGEPARVVTGPLWIAFADRKFLLFLLGSTGIAFVYMQAMSTFALQVGAHGFSSAVYGMLLTLNGLLVLVIELPLSSITRRFPPRPVMALGILLVGVGFSMTGVASELPFLIGTVVIWTMGEIISAPVASAYVADIAPEAMRGRYMGAFGLTFGLGLVLGPAIGASLWQVGPSLLWAACLFTAIVAAWLVLASGPSREASGE